MFVLALYSNRISGLFVERGITDKASDYADGGSRVGGYLIISLVLKWVFAVLVWLSVFMRRDNGKEYAGDKELFLLRIVFLFTLFSFTEMFVSMEMERITRLALVVGYILLTRVGTQQEHNNRFIMQCLMGGFVLVFFYVSMFRHYADGLPWYYTAFLPVFENNLFL